MKSEYKHLKIGDVVDIKRGSSPRPIQNYLTEKGMPWVKIADATSNQSRFISETKECIIEDGVKKSVVVTPETLIVSNSATPGLPKIMKITACVHDGWLVFSNYREVTRDYLYYKFIDIRRQLVNQANGSVFQNLKIDIVRDFSIEVPPIDIQNKIVSILESIDKKIELNNEINKNLEQQLQAIFESWFVRFDLNNGLQPVEWINAPLGDYVEIKRGGSPRPIQNFLSNSGLRWLKISDVTSLSSPYVLNIKEHIKEEGLNKTVLLKAGSLVLSNSATPGIPKIIEVDTCIHDGWLYFPKSYFSKYYLYLLFKYIRPKLIALGNGSVFTNLKTDILREYPIVCPDTQTLFAFDEIAFPLFEKIRQNCCENARLTEIMDNLLSKLMSGVIDVSDIDI